MRLLDIFSGRSRKAAGDVSLDTLIKRLEIAYETSSGVAVTPDNCEQSPTVKAIVTAVTRRFAVMPIHVYLKTTSKGRDTKELQPSHPVERLLNKPNSWQARTSFWMDSVSWLLRYGNVYCFKAQGKTGPILRLIPLHPSTTYPKQDSSSWNVTYMATLENGGVREMEPWEVLHVRLSARDGLKGDSPVMDVREAIALEIAAEKFGATFFGNGAMPGISFKYTEGSAGFKTDEERKAFLDEFQERFNRRGRFRAILPPKGLELGTPIPIENDKAQFIQLRQLQRTIIAGAFGVPPHLVGDLSKGTFNNVEQQGIGFKTDVILPLCRMFEAALERDLLTDDDRRRGIIIRFNPDGDLRGAFKERQEGLAIMRQNGVINANEWREEDGRNPRPDEGGEEYYATGPSGQTADPSKPKPADDGDDPDEDDEDAA